MAGDATGKDQESIELFKSTLCIISCSVVKLFYLSVIPDNYCVTSKFGFE